MISHFYDKKNREVAMCEQTVNVTFEITGSELVALLLEYMRQRTVNMTGLGMVNFQVHILKAIHKTKWPNW